MIYFIVKILKSRTWWQ